MAPSVAVRVAALAALAGLVAAAAGCAALGRSDREARVVFEGVVVAGETYEVELLGAAADAEPATALTATVTITNGYGESVEATCDERGRFRTEPITLSGHPDDRVVVACPGTRGLCLSALDAPVPEGTGGEPAVVRWRITLPPLDRAPGGGPA